MFLMPGSRALKRPQPTNNCRVYLAASQLGNAMNAYTKVNFDTIDSDPFGIFDAVNHRIRPKVAGTYLVVCSVDNAGSSAGVPSQAGAAAVSVNGTRVQAVTVAVYNNGTANETFAQCTVQVKVNGRTDYIEGMGGALGAGGTVGFSGSVGGSNTTSLSVTRVSS